MTRELINLGCRTNAAESDELAELLREAENFVVVNSCTVTTAADRDTRKAVARARREHPGAALVLMGCYVDAHLVATRPNARTDRSVQVRRLGAEAVLHHRDGALCDACNSSAPARVDRSHRVFLRIQQQDRDAIGGSNTNALGYFVTDERITFDLAIMERTGIQDAIGMCLPQRNLSDRTRLTCSKPVLLPRKRLQRLAPINAIGAKAK